MSPKKPGKNAPQIDDLHALLVRICGGRNPTQLPGVADYLWLQLIAETGTDAQRFRGTVRRSAAGIGRFSNDQYLELSTLRKPEILTPRSFNLFDFSLDSVGLRV